MPCPGLWQHGNRDCSCSHGCVVCFQVVPNAVSKVLTEEDLKAYVCLLLFFSFFLSFFFFFYVHWLFACMYACVRVSDSGAIDSSQLPCGC